MKYHSLQLRGEKRFANGLQFQGNFTWASAFDYANDYFYWNHDIDYGRESGVRSFVFNMSNIYELPFGKGHHFLNTASRPLTAVVGGWQLSNIWVYESGLPFTPSYLDCGNDEDTGHAGQSGGRCEYRTQSSLAGSRRHPRHKRSRVHQFGGRYSRVERERLHTRSVEPPRPRDVRQRGTQLLLRPAFL